MVVPIWGRRRNSSQPMSFPDTRPNVGYGHLLSGRVGCDRTIRGKKLALPDLVDSPLGIAVLPPGRHAGTFAELRAHFVDHPDVPFASERSLLMQALDLYAPLVWGLWPRATLWVNGGFVTHKDWAAPEDIDVVICDTSGRIDAKIDEAGHLITLLQATHQKSSVVAPKIQPMGGLIDGHPVGKQWPAIVAYYEDYWSTLLDKDKDPVAGFRKGYVEVVNPSASP